MKLTLTNPKSDIPAEWIPYLYGDEIDIKSVETELFRYLEAKPSPKKELFGKVFLFCIHIARKMNTKLGYEESNLQMGAVLIHTALIERALGE